MFGIRRIAETKWNRREEEGGRSSLLSVWLDWPLVDHPASSCGSREGSRAPWKISLLFWHTCGKPTALLGGSGGDCRESYVLCSKWAVCCFTTVTNPPSKTSSPKPGLGHSVIVTALIPCSEKLAVGVEMAGVYFGRRCICYAKFKDFPCITGKSFIIRLLHYETLVLILISTFSRKHEQKYKLKWNLYQSTM